MIKLHITDQVIGKIKELHGVNCAPYQRIYQDDQPYVKRLFRYARVPRSRLHDACGIWGGCHYVDIPNVFPDFSADPTDPASYDFHYTDEYIASIIETGAQIVYRLGVTIEWGSKKYVSFPPEDNRKWAVICEHVVRHYNEGWANGSHYGIEYWEIWNEPENPPMWQGTKEQFFELYRVASRHLRNCFPDLKIGGYGSCGFYAAIGKREDPFYRSFVEWFCEFLDYLKANDCPLDFYSWHIYTDCVEDVLASARFVRKTLDAAGFEKTESHLNEWNYGPEGGGFMMLESQHAAAFCAAVMMEASDCGVDMAQYYVASLDSRYNGLFNLRTLEYSPVVHAFAAYARLFEAGERLAVEGGIPFMAAAHGDGICALISCLNMADRPLTLAIEKAAGKRVTVYESLDESGFHPIVNGTYTEPVAWEGKQDALYYVLLTDNPDDTRFLFE